jgi:acyl carrier protein
MPMKDRILDVLRHTIAQQTGIEPETITPESDLSELGVNSLDLVEIIMSIEDKFDISIPDNAVDAWSRFKTVGDLMQLGEQLGLVRDKNES